MPNTKRNLRTCAQGHQYYKTSSCPTCPVCEDERKPQAGLLSLLAAPARRALEREGITTLKQLSKYREEEISALHSIGKNALATLRKTLADKGYSFVKES